MSTGRVELRGSWTVFIDFYRKPSFDADLDSGITAVEMWASPFMTYGRFWDAPVSMRLLWHPDIPLAKVIEFLERYKIPEPLDVITENFPTHLLEKAYRKMEYPS